MGFLKYILIFLLLLSGIGAAMHIISPPSHHINYKKSKKTTLASVKFSKAELMEIKDIDCSFSTLSGNVMDYLKNRSEYKHLLNKKLIVYNPEGSSSLNDIIRATEGLQHRIRYKKHFNFYRVKKQTIANMMTKFYDSKEDAKADETFLSKCHDYCIINPKNNQIFVVYGYDYTEENPPENIFDKLSQW